MRELPFVIAAYSVFWIVLGLYAYYLAQRGQRGRRAATAQDMTS